MPQPPPPPPLSPPEDGGAVGKTMVIMSTLVPVPVALVADSDTAPVVAAVGVPLMTPVTASICSPDGSPLALKLVGVPDALTVNVKAVPTVPVAVAALVITGAAMATVMVSVAVPVPLALVAVIVAELVPFPVGVPLMTPKVVFKTKPDGKPVAPNVVGLLLAVIV